MYDRLLIVMDSFPNPSEDFLTRATNFARMAGGTVNLLHVARGHIVASDINAGAGLGVLDGEDDVSPGERPVAQAAIDRLAAAGLTVHGEIVHATEHDVADIVLRRADELRSDVIVLDGRHHRGPTIAEHVLRRHPPCAVLLP